MIDTGAIRLTYTPDGQPFAPSNLQTVITRDEVAAHWTPGAPEYRQPGRYHHHAGPGGRPGWTWARGYSRAYQQPSGDSLTDDNAALTANVSASGAEAGDAPQGATDGVIGGYPGDQSNEWSAGVTFGAWLRLDWDTPQTVDRVVLTFPAKTIT